VGVFFDDAVHDELGIWALGLAPSGGADGGEVQAMAAATAPGDDTLFYDAWTAMASRLAAQGDEAAAAGHRRSAREAYQHAATYFGLAYRPLFGVPADPRLIDAFHRSMDSFAKAAALFDPPMQLLEIPYDGTTIPGYFLPAEGSAGRQGPLVIATNGYDATIVDSFFAMAVAASRHGYHCLVFDGPGQGRALIDQELPLRPDWEHVVTQVVDFVLARADVDPDRIALSGWSLGGYLAPRGASGEHRLAACIADPGVFGMAEGMRALAGRFGLSKEVVNRLPDVDPSVLQPMSQVIEGDRGLRWRIVQRGYMVHGVDSLSDYLRAAMEFTLEGRVQDIRCPTLLTMAENDVNSVGAPAFYDALVCPKQLLRFTAGEGAGDHCEMLNRTLVNRRIYDWLDDTLSAR